MPRIYNSRLIISAKADMISAVCNSVILSDLCLPIAQKRGVMTGRSLYQSEELSNFCW